MIEQDTKSNESFCFPNIEITYFENCYTSLAQTISLENALYRIKSGYSKDLIEIIRRGNKDLKNQLPCVSFSALLSDRTTLIKSSGLACLDFDKVKDLENMKKALSESEFIMSFWTSPSGNGIKALVKIPIVESMEQYKGYYNAILAHFEDLRPDSATKDLNRLCFESYDPHLFLNLQASTFTAIIQPQIIKKSIVQNLQVHNPSKTLEIIFKWWVKRYGCIDGERNNNLFILACKFSEFGIDMNTTQSVLSEFQQPDFSLGEIIGLIKSAYKKTEFNSKSL